MLECHTLPAFSVIRRGICRKRDCNSAGRRISGAQARQRNQDRDADKSAGDAPQHRPKEYREQHHEGRDRDRCPCDARLDIAADDELDDIKAGKYPDGRGKGFVLRGGEQGREQSGDEGSDKRNEVEDKGDDTPFAAEVEPADCGESPEPEPGQHAHAEPHEHIGLESAADFSGDIYGGLAKTAVANPAEATSERLQLEEAENNKYEGYQGEAHDSL